MGFVMDDRKVEEKWQFCPRSPLLLSLSDRKKKSDFKDVRGCDNESC